MLLREGKPIGQSEPSRLRAQLAIQPRRFGGRGNGGQWVWELLDAPAFDAGSLASRGHVSDMDR
jgi:hypothetical protein